MKLPSPPKIKTLVLVRHAHRDTSDRNLDNGLSDLGQQQAMGIHAFARSRFPGARPLLQSSERIRCVETLAPLAKLWGVEIQNHQGLLEQGDDEDRSGLKRRIREYYQEWLEQEAMLTVACTHGDWLEVALKKWLALESDFKKGCWIELTYREGKAQLSWLLPEFSWLAPPKVGA